MSLGKKLFHQNPAADSGGASSAQGLILHLDANDEDSIESGGANTGNGSGTWFDIANHDLVTPLADKASNLKLHLNASDTTSYGGSGDWKDISGSGIDGSISGATFESDTRGYFHFDGSDDVVTLSATDTSPINFSSETHTIEFWINFDNISVDDVIVGKFGNSNTTKSFQIQVISGNKLTVLERDGGSSNFYNTTGTFSTGVWTHFAYTRSASTVKLYINGTLDSSDTASNAINAGSTQDIVIGNQTDGGVFFDGRMSVLRIYNTTLTDSEVAQNFRADCFLSFSSIYSTDLSANFDPANYTSGTWDDSVGGIQGTISNAQFDKELGNFFSFDGSGDNIEMPDNSVFDMTTNRSLEMWVKRDDTTRTFVMDKAGGGNGWQIEYTSSNGYRYQRNDTGGSQATSQTGSNSTTGLWECISVTIASDNSQKIYLDGVLKDTQSSGTLGSNSANLFIGDYSLAQSYCLNGQIGDIKFYNAELTSAQVAQNYLAQKKEYPNGINGDIQGPTFQGGSTPFHFDFNGSTNYVDVPYTTLGDRDFTLTMYIKFDDLSAERYIWNKYLTGGGGEFGMIVQSPASSDKIVWQMYTTANGTAINITTSTSLTTTPYYHLAFVYVKETSAVIYLNGSSDGTDTYTGSNPFAQNSDQIRIGRYQTNTTSHDGEIGQVKIFDKALSASEVLAEFNATKATYGLS
jgi:hypothetical protein